MANSDWWLATGTTASEDGPATRPVPSEAFAANPLTRSVLLPVGKLTASSSGGWSSGYTVWQPFVPLQVQRVAIITPKAWENACADDVTLFRNSSSCVAGLTFTSTAIAPGTRQAMTLVNAGIAAGTTLTAKTTVSTCSVSADIFVQIDYITTG